MSIENPHLQNDIDLPDGNWVRLRDPKKVPERLRRPLMPLFSKMASAGIMNITEDDKEKLPDAFGLIFDMNDLVIIALVEAWSFGTKIDVDTLLDLPAEVYDALSNLTRDKVTELMPSFGISTDDASPT